MVASLALNYSISLDGKRVLMLMDQSAGQRRDSDVNVALHFFDEIARRLRAGEGK